MRLPILAVPSAAASAASAALSGALPACWVAAALVWAAPAHAGGVMSAEQMRAAFFGATLKGEYSDGQEWTERFDRAGRTVYAQDGASAAGRITFTGGRRARICFTYPDAFNGGCFEGWRRSANCFDFYGIDPAGFAYATARQRRGGTGWTARAWRTDRPGTCKSVPVG